MQSLLQKLTTPILALALGAGLTQGCSQQPYNQNKIKNRLNELSDTLDNPEKLKSYQKPLVGQVYYQESLKLDNQNESFKSGKGHFFVPSHSIYGYLNYTTNSEMMVGANPNKIMISHKIGEKTKRLLFQKQGNHWIEEVTAYDEKTKKESRAGHPKISDSVLIKKATELDKKAKKTLR